jgi:hypothetical protein
MILRRVMEHVKTQNWFAVGIDFVIVVTGVFIGIQVSNWNEVRKEGADRQLYIAQLIGDLEDIERRAKHTAQEYANRALAANRVMEFLRSERAAPDDPEQFERDLGLVGRASVPVPRSAAVIELLSTGRLGSMLTGEARFEVVRFDQFMQSAERASEVISDIRRDSNKTLQEKVSTIFRLSDDGRELLDSRLEYDLEAMRADPAMSPSLSSLLFLHRIEFGWRTDIAERAATLRERLEAER